jgi:hypothetical protein
MPETLIPLLVVTRDTPGSPLPDAVTGNVEGYYVADNDGNAVLHVNNPSGTNLSVSFLPQAAPGGFTLTQTEIEVPSGTAIWCGPFPPYIFNDSEERVQVREESPGALEFNGLRF